MGSRVKSLFALTRSIAARRLPWLRRARVKFCREADCAHRKKWRWFAHSNHGVYTVCFCRAAEHELTDEEIVGMAAHELGHVVGEALGFPEHRKATRRGGTPFKVQAEADWIACRVLGFRLRYNDRTLQEVY